MNIGIIAYSLNLYIKETAQVPFYARHLYLHPATVQKMSFEFASLISTRLALLAHLGLLSIYRFDCIWTNHGSEISLDHPCNPMPT